ncbi:hypothetical protein ACROYT_G002487 [Oculina patagonica]
MFRHSTAALVVTILVLSNVIDAKTDEFLEMKVFNHGFQASDSEMHAMLKKANLEGHGYKKEVTTKVVQKAGGGGEYQKAHYYYKDVSCSQMQEVEQELERLLPDAFQDEIGIKLKKEIKTRRLGSLGQCRVGPEVHFKGAEGCYDNQKAVSKRRKKRGCGGWICIVCFNIQITYSGNNNGNSTR